MKWQVWRDWGTLFDPRTGFSRYYLSNWAVSGGDIPEVEYKTFPSWAECMKWIEMKESQK